MSSQINRLRSFRVVEYLAIAIFALMPFTAFFSSWAGNNYGYLDIFRSWKELLLGLTAPLFGWLIIRTPDFKNWLIKSWLGRLIIAYTVLQFLISVKGLTQNNINLETMIYGLGADLRYLYFMLLCILVAKFSNTIRGNLSKILFWPSFIVIFVGLVQRFISKELLVYFYGDSTIEPYQTIIKNTDTYRVQSTLRGANPLGAYLVIVIPAIIGMLISKYKKIIVGLALVVLFLSYSRSAWIGLIISLILMSIIAIRSFKINLRIVSAIIAVLVMSGASVFALRDNNDFNRLVFHTSSEANGSESPNSIRLRLYKKSLNQIKAEPIGYGAGYAGPASTRNDPRPSHIPENYYLQIAIEFGIIGLMIFALINVIVATMLFRNRKDTLSKVLFVSFVGLVFVNLVSHAWADDTLAYLWWGLVGVALSPVILKAKHERKKSITT